MREKILVVLLFWVISFSAHAQETYAEKLGFDKNAKVLILHVDDVGMSYNSNQGAIEAIENGVANSLSIMMPCSWVPGFFKYLKSHPTLDAGLHLTLTSEWDNYRWGPLMGKPAVPGLVDSEGALWKSVRETASHASAEEVEKEIRAQLQRSREMGWEPTHMDSHMGTLFARADYLEKYIQVGIEENVPVMFPGGHNSMIMQSAGATGLTMEMTNAIGKKLWNAGLPVLDDIHNISYGWEEEKGLNDTNLQKLNTDKYIASFKKLKPGITMVIMHCTWLTEVFDHISDSGYTRKGDLLAMQDPRLAAYLENNNIVLTTWRELKQRRDKLNE